MRKSQISLLTVSVSVASLLLASSNTFAHAKYKENYKGEAPCPVVLTLKDGFYVGLQGGYDMYRIASEVPGDEGDIEFPGSLNDLGLATDPVVFAGGGVGGGFIGYGKYFDNMYGAYLGLEVFGNWSGAKTDYETFVEHSESSAGNDFEGGLYEAEYSVSSNYGIDFIPGIKLNPATLFYVRLGYNWANISVDEDVIGFTSSTGPSEVDFDGDSDTVGGFHYGVGIETTFMDNWSVRAEYTHTDFNELDSDGDDDNELSSGSEFSPAGNQFLLGIIYHFNM